VYQYLTRFSQQNRHVTCYLIQFQCQSCWCSCRGQDELRRSFLHWVGCEALLLEIFMGIYTDLKSNKLIHFTKRVVLKIHAYDREEMLQLLGVAGDKLCNWLGPGGILT